MKEIKLGPEVRKLIKKKNRLAMKEKSAYEKLKELRAKKSYKSSTTNDGVTIMDATYGLYIPDFVWDLINSFVEEREGEAWSGANETIDTEATIPSEIWKYPTLKSWQSHNRKRL